MSDVKRLGTDPLAWIGPGAEPEGAENPRPLLPAQSDPAPPEATGKGALTELAVRREDKETKAKLEKRLSSEQACAVLEAMLAGLRGGRLDLGREPGTWHLPVGRAMDVELKIAAKKDKARLALSLEWKID